MKLHNKRNASVGNYIDGNTSDEASGGSDHDTEVINPVLHFLINSRQNKAKGRKVRNPRY